MPPPSASSTLLHAAAMVLHKGTQQVSCADNDLLDAYSKAGSFPCSPSAASSSVCYQHAFGESYKKALPLLASTVTQCRSTHANTQPLLSSTGISQTGRPSCYKPRMGTHPAWPGSSPCSPSSASPSEICCLSPATCCCASCRRVLAFTCRQERLC